MTLFQMLATSTLGALTLWELAGWLRGRRAGWIWLLRMSVWIAAAVAIYDPRIVSWVAAQLGIQRGADLVTYAMALTVLGTSFYFYARYVSLQQQLTQVVRHLALEHPLRGKERTEPQATAWPAEPS